jgi:hypothetical protein
VTRVAALVALVLAVWPAFATAQPSRVVWAHAAADGTSAIWTTSATGTGAQRLIRNGNAPILAPDGRSIAFVRGGVGSERLYVHRLGGSARLVRAPAPGASFAQWTPDSSRLVWVSHAGRLVVVDVVTRRFHRLVANVLGTASIEPGGATALVTRTTGMRGRYPLRDIFRVDLASGVSTRLTKDGRSLGAVAGPARIAFSRVLKDYPDGPSTAVWTMDPDGGNGRPLTEVGAGQFGGVIPWRWSASGARLLGVRPSFVSSAPVAIDPATGETRNLRRGVSGYDVTLDYDARGNEVLALLRTADTRNGRLVALSYSTGRILRVYAAKASNATWARGAATG